MSFRAYLRLSIMLMAFVALKAGSADAQFALEELVTGLATGDGSGPELEHCEINGDPASGIDGDGVVAMGRRCSRVDLECLPDEEYNRLYPGTGMYTRNCKVTMPQSSCDNLGLHSGSYTYEEIARILGELPIENVDDIETICKFKHEIQHVKDKGNPQARPSCRYEDRGFQAEIECLEQYVQQYCDSEPQILSNEQCDELRNDICAYKGSQALNQCRCDSNHSAGNPCPECEETCGDVYSACRVEQHLPVNPLEIITWCESNGKTYCEKCW